MLLGLRFTRDSTWSERSTCDASTQTVPLEYIPTDYFQQTLDNRDSSTLLPPALFVPFEKLFDYNPLRSVNDKRFELSDLVRKQQMEVRASSEDELAQPSPARPGPTMRCPLEPPKEFSMPPVEKPMHLIELLKDPLPTQTEQVSQPPPLPEPPTFNSREFQHTQVLCYSTRTLDPLAKSLVTTVAIALLWKLLPAHDPDSYQTDTYMGGAKNFQ